MTCIYDSHTHSGFSFDGCEPPEVMIEHAAGRVQGICFTDHMDPDYGSDGTEWTFDPDRYFDALLPLCGQKKDLLVSIGMEFGMQRHLGPVFEKLRNSYPFEYIIGSQHLVYGEDPYEREVFRTHGPHDVVREYYTEILENLPEVPGIHSLGHIEYIFRYLPEGECARLEPYEDLIGAVLFEVIRRGIALEYNTGTPDRLAGLRCSIFALYRSMGGRAVTIGSDAHMRGRLGAGFDEACGVLKNLGFNSYLFYTKKGPKTLNI